LARPFSWNKERNLPLLCAAEMGLRLSGNTPRSRLTSPSDI
jgi:hypothetical protein